MRTTTAGDSSSQRTGVRRLPDLKVVRILAVDDDPQAAALIEMALVYAPFEPRIDVATTAVAGLARIKADEHDVYLIDQQLPDGTGIELIHQAKVDGVHKPLILLTGYGSGDIDEAASREGAADYVEKDMVGAHLERSIRYALRQWQASRALHDREEQLRQAQKMEAIGLLTGGVAHDFNNILTVIQANAEVLAQDAQALGHATEELAEIQRAAERAARLTQQLLAFSRKQVLQPRVVDASRVASQLLPMLRRVIHPSIRIEAEFDESLPAIRCDRSQLEQVVLNLALNARDAMPTGGTLRVGTEPRVLTAPVATSHTVVEPGRWVCITVADTGIGIAPELLHRNFEPFFTTKATGTGLGLGTVYGIVRQSGGVITVESTLGDGTAFTVWLPAVEERAEPAAKSARVSGERGQGTVLVVDDEAAVRSVLDRALRSFGYSVLLAADGDEAVAKARHHSGVIDLVLSDVAMPGMNGVEVLERLRELRPTARQMLMSGFAESPEAHAVLVRGEIGFLAKPFSIAQLSEAVRGAA
jgi:two-component system cell cycle sensor histidine kinase/response regulator CckA